MKKKQILIVAVILVVLVAGYAIYSALSSGSNEYPSRSISMNVFSKAGGGLDVFDRKVASLMEEKLGVKINVSNVTGGSGGEAVNLLFESEHDGYTWLGCSDSYMTNVAGGYHKYPAKELTFFLIGGAPGVICVPADSPYQTFEDLVDAAKADPGKITIGNSGLGKAWHLKAYLAMGKGEVQVEHVPYGGSRPAILACISGEVDACSASVGEVLEFVKAGQLRPIVMIEKEAYDYPGFGTVPPVTDTFPEVGQYLPIDQFLGFALPADTDPEILKKVDAAFKEAMEDPELEAYAAEQLTRLYKLSGEEANKVVRNGEAVLSYLLVDLGLANADPAEFGIERVG